MDGAARAVTLRLRARPRRLPLRLRRATRRCRAIGVWPKNARYGSCVGRVNTRRKLSTRITTPPSATGNASRHNARRVRERGVRHGQRVRPFPREHRRRAGDGEHERVERRRQGRVLQLDPAQERLRMGDRRRAGEHRRRRPLGAQRPQDAASHGPRRRRDRDAERPRGDPSHRLGVVRIAAKRPGRPRMVEDERNAEDGDAPSQGSARGASRAARPPSRSSRGASPSSRAAAPPRSPRPGALRARRAAPSRRR